MTRLTAEQVVGSLLRDIDELKAMKTNSADWKASGIDYAVGVISATLAPRWKDAQDGDDGLVWVEFSEKEKTGYWWGLPFSLWFEDGEWWIEDDDEFVMKLEGRRVCPIGERPKDGE